MRRSATIPLAARVTPAFAPAVAATRPPVMVVSHERSGTHFLLNSIAAAYGYPPTKRLDLDQTQLPINFFKPDLLARVIGEAAAKRPDSMIKSHHCVDFFDGVLDEILVHTTIFYIHRNPVDVMVSLWRYINFWNWREGPKTRDVVEFAAAAPEGHMMRYQMRQQRNLLQRWARHVEGWLAASLSRPRIVTVSYESLDGDFGNTVLGLERVFGRKPETLARPPRDQDVINIAPRGLGEPDRDALRRLALAEVGDTMRALGYA